MQATDPEEETMFKTILWATDGSDNADKALPYAKELASGADASLVVAHCVETFVGSRVAGLPVAVGEEETKAKVERQTRELREEGFEARSQIVPVGAPRAAHSIADIARDVGADVIVVGTRGNTPLGGLLVGSVTQRLLHVAPCPVLAVPAIRAGVEKEPAAAAHANAS
jgi:nucleotide-binding universal stress UspA family protein